MNYREYKSIGRQISQLGFGCMRFPCKSDGTVKRLKSIQLLRLAFRKGINYYDTAHGYHGGKSEEILGQAVKPFREKVVISTKNPIKQDDTSRKWFKRLDISIQRLGFPPDILNFHSLRWKVFIKQVKPRNKGLLTPVRRAQAQGLFRHLAFSCHDTPENMIKLLDTDEFVGITLQYNLLDRRNESVMEHAYKKGLGVVVMGPVGGGKLGVPSARLQQMVPGGVKSTPEIALRFVLSNHNVTTAISGMSTQAQLQENIHTASMKSPLSHTGKRKVKSALLQIQKLAQLYCTGCGYCMPCPNKVNIPRNFELMNLYRVWGLKELARRQYARLTDPERTGLQAGTCKECGACLPKCPQKIDIIQQLKETHKSLGSA